MSSLEAEFPGYFPLPVARPTASGDVSRRASGSYRAWDGSQEVWMPECICECGGRLVADTRVDEDVLRAVQTHNALPVHLVWRERSG